MNIINDCMTNICTNSTFLTSLDVSSIFIAPKNELIKAIILPVIIFDLLESTFCACESKQSNTLPNNVIIVAIISNLVIGYLHTSLNTIMILPHKLEKNSACDINVIEAATINKSIHIQHDIEANNKYLIITKSLSS